MLGSRRADGELRIGDRVMDSVLSSIEMLPVSTWMRAGVWPFPVVNTIHVFGIAFLVGGIAVLDLRLLGLGWGTAVADLASLVLPIAVAGFLLAIVTGGLMFAANPREYTANPYLPWKLALIGLALVNVVVLHATVWRSRAGWGTHTPPSAKAAAAASLLLWGGTITCGRLMAYF